jgi:hypothetical protein
MSTAEFVVSFHGPGVEDGTIDVRDLAPALLSLGQAVDAANIAINGSNVPARVKAKAVSQGSFEVSLEVVLSGWEYVRGLLMTSDGQAAATLITFLGFFGFGAPSLITLYRWLNGRLPDLIERHGSEVTVILGEERLTVPMEVLRLYQDVAVNQSLGRLLTTLQGDRVDRIEFKRSRGAPPEQTLTKADREAFALPEAPEETIVEQTRPMALSIRSLAFQEGNKWRLFDGQNVITATIEDPEFLERVERNEVRFAKSDVLICEVRTVQKQTAEGLKTEHFVQRVLEYRSAPTQIDLFK